MGFRSAIKKGGGFLSNVDAELEGYDFTAKFKGDKKDGEWVYFVPRFKVDGADEAVDQHMFLGGSDTYTVSDDGQELSMADDSPVTFGGEVPFGILMDSLFDAAEKADINIESELPDLSKGEALTLESLVGRRFRLKQKVNDKANAKLGKRKVKGKNGKTVEYDRTDTVIDAILGEAPKGGKAPAGKSGGKSKATSEDALKEEAADVLKDVLAKGPVKRKDLSLPVSKALLKNANRDALKAIILDEDWQGEQDWLTVDKKGNLSVD